PIVRYGAALRDRTHKYPGECPPATFSCIPASFVLTFRRMEAAMSLRSPILRNLLALSAIAVLAHLAIAQSQSTYDPATEAKLKGIVEELKLDPPTGGKPVAYLVIKIGENKTQVFLCPKSFLDEIGATFSPGDNVQITGSKISQGGSDLILAREVEKS